MHIFLDSIKVWNFKIRFEWPPWTTNSSKLLIKILRRVILIFKLFKKYTAFLKISVNYTRNSNVKKTYTKFCVDWYSHISSHKIFRICKNTIFCENLFFYQIIWIGSTFLIIVGHLVPIFRNMIIFVP